MTTTSLSEEELGLPTPSSRPACAALTSARLGAAWPEVSGRLERLLASRGVDPVLRDDIVQEVAVRALDKQVPFTDPDDLYRWAATTARNLHVDHLRTGGRTIGDEVLAAVPDVTDVAHAVERRVALDHVWRALAAMRPGERDAILESLDEEKRARTSQALVRRHRARASLRKAVGGVLVWTGAAWLRVRTVVESPAFQTAGAATMLAPVLAYGAAGGARPDPAPRLVVRQAAAAPAAADRAAARPVAAPRAAAPRTAPRPADVAGAPVTSAVRAPGGPAGEAPDTEREIDTTILDVDHDPEPKQEDDKTLCLTDMPDGSDLCLVDVEPPGR